MAEQVPFPKTLFSKDETQNQVKDSVTGEVLCGSRAFQSQEEVDAAGGSAVWKATPQEAQQSQQQPQAGQPRQPERVLPGTQPTPEDDEPHAPRSRR